jgi:serine/threonine protein kinase
MALARDTRLGPYRIVSPLADGGMAEVYRARDERDGREVAVKLLPSHLARDRERVRRFAAETHAASRCEHPGLLTVFDVGTSEEGPYLVTELLCGETLRQRLTNGPLPVPEALRLASELAEALAAAHRRGILHRDLKPENLFLVRPREAGAAARLKVLDFGLAKLLPGAVPGEHELARAITAPGMVLGTAGYMAPEQARGETADVRADVFGVGLVLYEMVTGERAFPAASPVEALLAVLGDEPRWLREAGGPLPPNLRPLLARCLAKSREERFSSAEELARALEALRATLGPGAEVPPAVAGKPGAAPHAAEQARGGCGRRLASLGLLALALLAALAAGVGR